MRRGTLIALLAAPLAAVAFMLAPAATSATATLLAYSDFGGSLYLSTTAGAAPTTLLAGDGSTSVQPLAIVPGDKNVLVLRTGATNDLALVPTTGGSATSIAGTANATSGGISPDGKTVVFTTGTGIETVPVGGGTPTTIVTTPDGASDALPVFAPNGKQIAFARDSFDTNGDETDAVELVTVGSSTVTQLANGALTDFALGGKLAFSPDGKTIAYVGDYASPGIFTVAVAGGTPARLTTDNDSWPAYSVDGKTIYFARDGFSTNADGQSPTPQKPVADDIDELWSIGAGGASATVIDEGDFEALAVATSTSAASGGGGTTTAAGGGTTTSTGTTKTTTTPKTTTTTTVATVHSISLSISGHRYTARWQGTATTWTVTLKVGGVTKVAKLKGSVHAHVFTVTRPGAATVRVAGR